MPNAIETQALVNGARNLVLKIAIDGDGSGDESATVLVDVSAYDASVVRVIAIHSALVGFSASLYWDATTDKLFMTIPDFQFNQDFRHFGGLQNNAGTGKNGDILITTVGLGAADHGHIILEMVKD